MTMIFSFITPMCPVVLYGGSKKVCQVRPVSLEMIREEGCGFDPSELPSGVAIISPFLDINTLHDSLGWLIAVHVKPPSKVTRQSPPRYVLETPKRSVAKDTSFFPPSASNDQEIPLSVEI